MNKPIENTLIKKKLFKQVNIGMQSGKTYIYACVKNNKTIEKNGFSQLDCKNLNPVTSHIFNINTNTISVYCEELKFIGSINFVLKFKFNNSNSNYINIPIPNNLIYSCLNSDGKNKYNVIKNKYKGKGLYNINFLQLIKI